MEEFKVNALSSAAHPLCLWLRLEDVTFVIQEAKYSKQLLHHINSQDPHIQVTVNEPGKEGALPFLDTLVSLNTTLVTMVIRKPTYTNQYLYGNSNHFITAKTVSSILKL